MSKATLSPALYLNFFKYNAGLLYFKWNNVYKMFIKEVPRANGVLFVERVLLRISYFKGGENAWRLQMFVYVEST